MSRLNRVNISYIMTCGSKKDYNKAAVNLSVDKASTGVDRCRGLPSTPHWDLAKIPGSNSRIHLNNDAGKFE
jgi:hypothetical protein